MARPPRVQIANGIYHVVARGNERSPIYRDDGDRRHFLELVAEVRERHGWRILAYCLMGNHYHLLVRTPQPNLARCMRRLNGGYAQSFNRRHARVGHLLQGRYGARLVQADEHLLSIVRYIVRNPVRAGLCSSPAEWRWSSHRAMLGQVPPSFLDVSSLLSFYAPERELARARYCAHAEEGGREERPVHPLVEGDDVFVASALERFEPAPGVPRRYLRAPRRPLESLLGSADGASLAAASAEGYSLREIARHLGVNASTVSRRLRRQGQLRGATEGT